MHELNKIILMRRVEECSGSLIQNCGCDQEGRRLRWETRAEEVGFKVFPERCNRGTVSYMKGEFQRTGALVTEGIREVFDL